MTIKTMENSTKPGFKALILDFDGVVIDSVGIKDGAFKEIFSRFPNVFNEAMNYHFENSGFSRNTKFKFLLSKLSASERKNITLQNLCNEFSQKVVDKILKCPFMPGAIDLLTYFKGKLDIFLASITPQEELDYIVKSKMLFYYFKGIHGGISKKNNIIRNILTLNSLSPRNVIFIGDTLQDYEAALATNVIFIGLKRQHQFPTNTVAFETIYEIKNFIIKQCFSSENNILLKRNK